MAAQKKNGDWVGTHSMFPSRYALKFIQQYLVKVHDQCLSL